VSYNTDVDEPRIVVDGVDDAVVANADPPQIPAAWRTRAILDPP
jgi:hypothetical protein